MRYEIVKLNNNNDRRPLLGVPNTNNFLSADYLELYIEYVTRSPMISEMPKLIISEGKAQ